MISARIGFLSPQSSFDADALAYLTAVETADGQALESSVRTAINAFVVGCKTDGTWSSIKAACILCGARTLSGALVPLVGSAPTNNNFVSGDYARGTSTPGLKGNGTTKYLDANRANNADPQNDFHASVYVTALLSSPLSAYGMYVASSSASATTQSYNYPLSGYAEAGACRGSGTGAFASATRATGFKGMSRSASGSFTYRTNATNYTVTNTSSAPSTSAIHIYAQAGTTSNRNDGRFAWYSIGTSLTMSLLESRLSTLVSAISAAIP